MPKKRIIILNMGERYIAAVDLGSSKIALTVAKVDGEDVQIQYYKERPSMGIRNSAVFNPKKAGIPIREAINEAEEELKIKIMQVVVGLPRCDIRQELSKAKVERNNPEQSITADEVDMLKTLAKENYPLENPEKEKLYGAVAQSFSDDTNFQLIESDIIGVISQTFEGNFKLFIGKKSSVKTIDKVFNDLEVGIACKYFTPDSISRAVLTDDEMENGVALIDLGGGATSVTIYKGKILRYYASIPFGGKVITSDIRTECSISEQLAENIKKEFGACLPEKLQNLGEKIIQIEGDDVEGYKQIPVKYLSEIITCRVREIIDAILYEIQESGMADILRNGIVITGGGAELGNIATFIKELSGYNVRIGYSRHKFSASGCNGVYSTSSTTSIGMILTAKDEGLLSCIEAPEVTEQINDVKETVNIPDEIKTPDIEEEIEETQKNEKTEVTAEKEEPDEMENSEKPEVTAQESEKAEETEENDKDSTENTDLFGDKIEEPKKTEKDKNFPKKIQWTKIVKTIFGDLYNKFDNESV